MKLSSNIILAVSLFCLASCSETKKTETNAGIGTAPVNFSSPNTTQQPTGSTAGLNPEHGQPGHRCDIPVGTPLNSPAQPAQSTQPGLTNPAVLPVPAAGNTAVTTGTNPPHGQPGHDCSIAVGAPLNK